MNHCIIGIEDKAARFVELYEPRSLLIDDGPIADEFAARFNARIFDPTVHSFNPLKGIDARRARDIATILYTASPQGENTLTVRNGRRALARILRDNPTRLDRLKFDNSDAEQEAKGMVEDILFSPILKRVLCNPTNFSFKGSVAARIDRAELGDDVALVLALLLIGQAKGQVIVPDFGSYGRELHMSLIRQNRLTAGVNFLAELPVKLQQALLTIKDKTAARTTTEDAVRLAQYAGLLPGTTAHTDYVQRAIGV